MVAETRDLPAGMISELTEEWLECMEGDTTSFFARMAACGHLPSGVDEHDPRVQAVIRACREAYDA
jgi:hypothetical protein